MSARDPFDSTNPFMDQTMSWSGDIQPVIISPRRKGSRLARLFVRDRDGARDAYELTQGKYGIGRAEANEIRLNDPKISRNHCRIDVRDEGYILSDLGSRNGTLLNGVRITEYRLSDGDEISVGNSTLQFKEERREEPAPRDFGTFVEIAKDEETDSTFNYTITSEQAEQLYSEIHPELAGRAKGKDILAILYEVGNVINTLSSLHQILRRLLDLVFDVLPADRGFIMLVKDGDGQLVPGAVRNDVGESDEKITLSNTIAREVCEENTSVLTKDAMQDDRFSAKDSVVLHNIRSAMCVPLSSPTKVHGIFYLDTKFSSGVYSEHDLELLTAIGRQAGIAIENAKLYEEQKRTIENLIETLAASVDARDPQTAGHSDRVATHSVGIAKAMGLSKEEQEIIRYAAYLHDYGKIGVSDAVLQKPGKLTKEEFSEIKGHAAYTASILSRIRFAKRYRNIPAIASGHHEKIDGSGYPEGLSGEAIPLGARIIAVADVFDALSAKRYYKDAMSDEQVYKALEGLKGRHLDADVVDAFEEYWRAARAEEEEEDQQECAGQSEEDASPS